MEKFRPLKNTFFKAMNKKNNEVIGTGKKLCFQPTIYTCAKKPNYKIKQGKIRK